MLQIHDADGVRVLTLDRPEKLNAMTTALYRACAGALAEAAASDAIGAVVITGNGRAFCAGNDLGELMGAAAGDAGADQGAAFAAFMDAVSTFPKPFLAAVNGVGVGIGMTLLPYCDVALIAESARLRGPFVPLGVAPEAGSSATLAATMGWQRAARLLLSGAWLERGRRRRERAGARGRSRRRGARAHGGDRTRDRDRGTARVDCRDEDVHRRCPPRSRCRRPGTRGCGFRRPVRHRGAGHRDHVLIARPYGNPFVITARNAGYAGLDVPSLRRSPALSHTSPGSADWSRIDFHASGPVNAA